MKQETTIMGNQHFRPLDLKKKIRPGESIIQTLLFISGVLSIFITVAIVYELGKEALLFFNNPDVTLAKFLGTTRWQPGIGLFGIWPLDDPAKFDKEKRLASTPHVCYQIELRLRLWLTGQGITPHEYRQM